MATPQDQRPLPDEKNVSVGVAIATSEDDTPVQVATSDADDDLKPIPWTYKWIALACVIAFPIGQTWTNASLGPLKNTLRNELGITNAQFGVISSADSFVNSIFPIIGGMTLDWWGPNRITICCTMIIFVGATVAAVAIHLEAWRVLAAGHVLMGFGTAILDQAQQKFVYHWFGAGGLAFAFGLENAISSTVGMVAGMVAIPIRDRTGWYGWTFWIPAIFCGVSMAINIVYVFFERIFIPKHLRLTSARAKALAQNHKLNVKRVFSWRSLFGLPWQYLMLPGTQVLQSGGANGFGVSASDIIRMKGYSEETAGFMSTGQRVLRILGSPIIGWLIDRYGHRFHYVALAPLFYIISNSLIGFTNLHPLVALVFQSMAGLINGMPLNVCIPLLVADQDKLGTAFGIWRAFNNSGGTIMDVAYGVLQDGTKDMGYSKVLKVSTAIKAWGFAVGCCYIILDHKKLGKEMTLTRNKREAIEAEIVDRDSHPLTKREVKKPWTIYTLSMLVAMIATAWTLFIKYLL
ncbi:MFS transporter [Colletotrichum truncatum]|uniref:MFS transporter n=1 Tax=Colletotrichum truncatum TaxID=5467 RepID=A0ACC3ZDF1_COLTU|nr:MFS transporter [Colletotrichum truncatum]KAF6798000.1 MFS transporter [Colletotrichum truncatum]